MPGFRLRKWYLDVVSDDGTAIIGYHAVLRRGWLRAAYASIQVFPPHGRATEQHTLRCPGPPLLAGDVSWDCPPLGLAGRWRPEVPPLALTLLAAPGGSVVWTVPAPRAEVRLSIGDRTWEGYGYAEVLELDIAPWRLPFRLLHWGRFVSAADAAVWILWDEGRQGAWVRHNGTDVLGIEAGEEAIRLGDGCTIALEGRRPLRSGPITAPLRALPWPLRRAPRAFHAATEEKWLSHAHTPSGSGWALYETVRLR